MPVKMRTYSPEPLFTDDYVKVREFLRSLNRDGLAYPGFPWGRWEWMTTHAELDRSSLGRIGLWEEEGRIVGLATYETALGDAYLFTAPGYEGLWEEMLSYAKTALAGENGVRVLIDNNNRGLQRAAVRQGFFATGGQENTAMLDITDSLSYSLPEGYRIISMDEGWDFAKYHAVMWRGFHAGQPLTCTEENIRTREQMLSSPMLLPRLVLAAVAPGGDYVSHCGMWYAPGDSYALVEPVATDSDYRLMGLGKAVVLEAAIRCGRMGAKTALVGSSQQFYYKLGFYPVHTGSWWTCAGR